MIMMAAVVVVVVVRQVVMAMKIKTMIIVPRYELESF